MTAPFVNPAPPTSGVLAVTTTDEILALLPAEQQNSELRPILDALIETLLEMALAWQDAGTGAAAQSDVATADDQFLDGLGRDRDFNRSGSEQNDPFRVRIEAIPKCVTPEAIVAAANAVMAPYTPETSDVFDSILDRWFVTDGTASFHSFVGASPDYPDRLYPDEAPVNGAFRPNSDVGGAWAFSDHVGRYFVLRVPNIAPIDDTHMFVFDALGADPPDRSFVGDGSQSDPAAFATAGNQTALEIYQAVTDNVNAIQGSGFRWLLTVKLNPAPLY